MLVHICGGSLYVGAYCEKYLVYFLLRHVSGSLYVGAYCERYNRRFKRKIQSGSLYVGAYCEGQLWTGERSVPGGSLYVGAYCESCNIFVGIIIEVKVCMLVRICKLLVGTCLNFGRAQR